MQAFLSDAQVAAFAADGFLVVPNVIDDDTLRAVRTGLDLRVRDLMRRYQNLGQCDAPGEDFNDNMTRLLAASSGAYQHVDISLPMVPDYHGLKDGWRTLFGDDWEREAGIYLDDSIFALLTHPNVVNIARQFVGDDVIASPVQHVRIKPPQRALSGSAAIDANTARTLWHQDEAVVTEAARGVNILTVWLAVSEATLENGCMMAVAGSHLREDDAALPDFGLTAHCPGKGDLVGEIYIPDADVPRDNKLTPLLAQPGDAVLLHKRTVHGAGANRGDGVRWSFDLRYQPMGTPTGRACFPETPVYSKMQPEVVVADAAVYRQNWLARRDAILNGDVKPVFNDRWLKYNQSPVCA